MFLETIYSPGVAHLSYIAGDDGKAFVIDPRRDIGVYLDIARREGCRITHVFETHRNEDYVIGSVELANISGAKVYHGAELDFKYGNPVHEGDSFEFGNVLLRVLHTPGHTMESISLVYHDREFSDDPLGVFTGDALFIGDVGRTDFFPDRKEKVAGMLYDSIFQKLLPLGDHVLLWPAHGAGSVCGSGMAERNFSTLGYELRNNPVLQKTDRDEFIRYKATEYHYLPPYFKRMEKYNLEGAPPLAEHPWPRPLSAEDFHRMIAEGMDVVDVRSPEAFAGTHVPGSLSLPLEMVPAFAGWFLNYDRPLGLVVEEPGQVGTAVRHLARVGSDGVVAFLAGGLHAWETAGFQYNHIGVVDVRRVEERLDRGESFTLLDVRGAEEFEAGHLRDAVNLYVGELPSRLDEIPRDRPITTFCGSGQRAMVAASYLRMVGFENIEDCLGSMAACERAECQVVTA